MTNEVRFIESSGKDVASAVAAGLKRLGVRRNQVIVEVLEEGSRGFLGIGGRESTVRITLLIGLDDDLDNPIPPAKPKQSKPKQSGPKRDSRQKQNQPKKREAGPTQKPRSKQRSAKPNNKPNRSGKPQAKPNAQVASAKPATPKATPKPKQAPPKAQPKPAPVPATTADGEPIDHAEEIRAVTEMVQTLIVEKMQTEVEVSAAFTEPDDMTGRQMLLVKIDGDNIGSLIGPRGEALNALQYIIRLMAGHKLRRRINIALDIAGYRERRREALARLAERMAKKVEVKKRPVTLEPMPPFERRIIHMTLRGSQSVSTNSIGDGGRRRVRIYPKRS